MNLENFNSEAIYSDNSVYYGCNQQWHVITMANTDDGTFIKHV